VEVDLQGLRNERPSAIRGLIMRMSHEEGNGRERLIAESLATVRDVSHY
jgi:hypothetical protein